MVRVVLHGELRQFVPRAAKVVEIEGDGRTAADVLRALGIPLAEAMAVVVDGEQEELGRVLRDGEVLEAIPAISGGEPPPQRDRPYPRQDSPLTAGGRSRWSPGSHDRLRRSANPKFPPEMADVLLAPERRTHLDPARALGEFGLKAGATIADLGCGPGFFTVPAAKIVGPRGHVHAADVQPEMLARVREAADANHLANVETHLVREEYRNGGWRYDFGIASGSVNLALVAFVLHETEDAVAFLRSAATLLKRSGRIALLQWQKRDTYAGPAVQVRMAPEETLAAVRAAGLRAQEAPPLDPDHYAFFLRP